MTDPARLSAIEDLIADTIDHLDKAEAGLHRLHEMKANREYELTWEAFMQRFFGKSARWLYDQLHALEVRETLLSALPPEDCAVVHNLPVSTLREFRVSQQAAWVSTYETALHVAKEHGGSVTASIVQNAAKGTSEAILRQSINGYPLTEIVAAGIIEEQRDRAIVHSKRVYLVKDHWATWDYHGDDCVLHLGDVGDIPTSKWVHIDLWYEDESGPT